MAPASRIDELTARYAENPRRYFAPLANEHRKTGDPERAIALCRVHLPSQPGHMSGHIVLGQALLDLGELAAARTAFATAVALDDENLVALRHLGDIARIEGDSVEARAWYARVLDADPMQADVAALQAELVRASAERETQAQDAELVAAEADGRPLPTPTQTPFPGGLGFSEEELDAFIAHVPVVEDTGASEAPAPVTLPPLEFASATEQDVAGGPDAAESQAPPDAAPAVVDFDAIEAAGAAAPISSEASPQEPMAVEAEDAVEASVAQADESEPMATAQADGAEILDEGSSAEAEPEPEHGDRPTEDDESMPIVDIAALAPDEAPEATDTTAPRSADMEQPDDGMALWDGVESEPALAEPTPTEVEPVAALSWMESEPTVVSDEESVVEEASDEWQAESADATTAVVEDASEHAEGEHESVAGLASDIVSPEDAPGEPTVEAVDAPDGSSVEAGEPVRVEGAAPTDAVVPSEAPPASMPEVAAAAAPLAPVAPPATTRGVTPVRSAALRLLASLAPWREGAVPLAPESPASPAPSATDGAHAAAAEAAVVARAHEVEDASGENPGPAEPDAAADGERADAATSADDTSVEPHADADRVAEPSHGDDAPTEAVATVERDDEVANGAFAERATDDGAEMATGGGLADAVPTDGDPVTMPTPTVARPTPAGFTTATMAELYRRQGFLAEALAVYRELASRDPEDAWYQAQVSSLESEINASGREMPHEVGADNSHDENDFGDASDVDSPAGTASSLTPPGFASLAAELADATPPTAAREVESDWFADAQPEDGKGRAEPSRDDVASGDDWFAEGAEAPRPAVDEATEADGPALFGMDDELPMRAPMPTPVSLDALGGGLDELFGLPVIAAADESAARWLEALGGELTTRATAGALDLPVPEALDVPRGGGGAGAPGPLLSFDRFFGATPPGVRRQETPAAGGEAVSPVASLGPSFGGTPVIAPRPPEPSNWSLQEPPSETVPPPPSPPRPDAPGAAPSAGGATEGAGDGPSRPKSDFHRWLEGLN
jgi:hypothetical protein